MATKATSLTSASLADELTDQEALSLMSQSDPERELAQLTDLDQSIDFPEILDWRHHLLGVTALVRPAPGTTVNDWIRASGSLAATLRLEEVVVKAEERGRILVDLYVRDGLGHSDTVTLRERGQVPFDVPITVGLQANRDPVDWDYMTTHALVNGDSGSGKTVLAYSVIGQAVRRGIGIHVCDFQGLLGRPFGSPGPHEDPADYAVAQIRRAHEVMVDRRQKLPALGLDTYRVTEDDPPQILVIDELPALLTYLDSRDKNLPPKERVLSDVHSMLTALTSVGRKYRCTILAIAQRGDTSVLPGYMRALFGLRISMRQNSLEGIRMTIPGLDSEIARNVLSFKEGVFLADSPTQGLVKGRTVLLPQILGPGEDYDYYQAYLDAVTGSDAD